MLARLRTSIGTRISFFSFQDIITSVTGILILVTLILTLYLEQSVPVSAEQEQLKQKLGTLLNELTRVSAQNQQRQTSLQALASAPDPERLHAEIKQWQNQLSLQSNRLASMTQTLTKRQSEALKKADQLGLSDLRERAGTIQKEIEARQLTNAVLTTEAKEIEKEEKELKARVEQAASQHRLWLLPDTTTAGKKPVLVTVSHTNLICEQFNLPASRKEFAADRAEAGLAQSLGQWNRERDYLVFYVRPSGIELFARCLEIAKRAGFQVGYDAVEEDKQIIFSEPAPP
jgi:hypothetical protein